MVKKVNKAEEVNILRFLSDLRGLKLIEIAGRLTK
jgi:hypothetical protein